MNQAVLRGRYVQSSIKWFDPSKGYGFVVAPDGGRDILLHANVLRNFGQGSVVDGVGIELLVQDTARGTQAIEVLSLDMPAAPEIAPLDDIAGITPEALAALPLTPARVKWFDKAKGFGFANGFGTEEDVFLHIEVLRHGGLADLQPGEAVCLKVIDGRRGRMACSVLPWEA
ncbi:MAG: cold-shock protein, partial [Shimia sp.]